MSDQLALATTVMSLEEVVSDHCDPFDEVIRRLEIEAMEEAQLDDEAQPVEGVFPLVRTDGSEPDDDWSWI